MGRRRFVEDRLRETVERFGFGEVMTPTFENIELFVERSGEGIVDEMYAFQDKGGRDIALRPELTAPVMRSYVNELSSRPKPQKLFYFGNVFRYERPQSGRYREFFHFGAELIGAPSIDSDAEIIALAQSCIKSAGLEKAFIRIGHLDVLQNVLNEIGLPDHAHEPARRYIDKGDEESLDALLAEQGIDSEDSSKLTEIINLKGGKDAINKAQLILEGGDEAFTYLSNLLRILEKYGFEDCMVDFGVARGLDYYTGMVFEIDSPSLGAEKQICGGGSYSLAELFGGEEVNSTGFAFGFDRLILALENEGVDLPLRSTGAYVIPIGSNTRDAALEILANIRDKGISADIDLMGRKMSKALAYANSTGVKKAVIIGERELAEGCVVIRDMDSGEQQTVKIGVVTDIL
jgi:histidyl-tRNA synthetase